MVAVSDDADIASAMQVIYDAELADRLARERHARESAVGTELCVDCEGDIPLPRRQAMPWVTRCVPCQEDADRQAARHR